MLTAIMCGTLFDLLAPTTGPPSVSERNCPMKWLNSLSLGLVLSLALNACGSGGRDAGTGRPPGRLVK